MNYVRSSNPNLIYHRFTPSGCRDIGFGKLEFVAKTQFLCNNICFQKRFGFLSIFESDAVKRQWIQTTVRERDTGIEE